MLLIVLSKKLKIRQGGIRAYFDYGLDLTQGRLYITRQSLNIAIMSGEMPSVDDQDDHVEKHLRTIQVSFGGPTENAADLKTAVLVTQNREGEVLMEIWEVDGKQFQIAAHVRAFQNMTNHPIGEIRLVDAETNEPRVVQVYQRRGDWQRPSQRPPAMDDRPEKWLIKNL